MPERIEVTDPDGVDYGWVMQVTFVLAIVVGAPLIAVLSLFASVPTWTARVTFAVQVGAVVWLVLALVVYAYARWVRASPGADRS
jgi:hypothetical protein